MAMVSRISINIEGGTEKSGNEHARTHNLQREGSYTEGREIVCARFVVVTARPTPESQRAEPHTLRVGERLVGVIDSYSLSTVY